MRPGSRPPGLGTAKVAAAPPTYRHGRAAGRRALAWLAGVVTVAALLGAASGPLGWTSRPAVAAIAPGPTAAANTPRPAAAMVTPRAVESRLPVLPPFDGPIPIDLYRFALNALLVPLLDESEPLRWTDAAIMIDCGPGTRVLVDGEPMVPGAPIPTEDFAVRWLIDHCMPLGVASVELSGAVDLRVTHEEAGLSAVVAPDGLVVSSALGSTRLRGPFAAVMPMGDMAARGR
jgi:hypothetical protein